MDLYDQVNFYKFLKDLYSEQTRSIRTFSCFAINLLARKVEL